MRQDVETARDDNSPHPASPPLNSMPVGRHIGIGSGLLKAISYAQRINCRALQVFPGNPTGWRHTPLADEAARGVRAATQSAGITSLVIHAPYILNLAGPDETLYQQSCQALVNSYSRAAEIGAAAIVLHTGSHRGSGVAQGIARLVDGVSAILPAQTGPTMLLLENSAGAGNTLGGTFEELAAMLADLPPNRVGLCLDTAHVWGAGHDISTPAGGLLLVEELSRTVGLHRLGVLHFNDSAVGLGSHRDVHARLGDGQIGLAGLAGILQALQAADVCVPILLETPDDGPARESGWQQLVAGLLAGDLEEAQARQAEIMALPIEKGSFPDDVTGRKATTAGPRKASPRS